MTTISETRHYFRAICGKTYPRVERKTKRKTEGGGIRTFPVDIYIVAFLRSRDRVFRARAPRSPDNYRKISVDPSHPLRGCSSSCQLTCQFTQSCVGAIAVVGINLSAAPSIFANPINISALGLRGDRARPTGVN